MLRIPFILGCFLICATHISAGDDIMIADFEGETYAEGWTTEGTAFGTGPARGTLPHQMNVTGFFGKGLVNSYLGGDGSKGKLTSPAFKIERPYLSFLIGGGGHDGLGVHLWVDGKTVRTARGTNVVPGGSERLGWYDWDVSEFMGKEGRIEIVDDAAGSWGHINADQILLSARKRMPVEKRVVVEPKKEFLHLPVTMDAPETWVRVEVDGAVELEFICPLTVQGEPDFFANLQIGPWKDRHLELIAETVPPESEGLTKIVQDDRMAQEETVYTEKYRPQFHFSTRTGWINDPNGLVYYEGIWHLFFQHNPYSTRWGNMTWGHATSPDLLHWTEHPAAIHPDKLGTIFSGSGVVDWNNSAGFQRGDKKTLVFFYTYSGSQARHGAKTTQGLAYSTDGGKNLAKYDKNPIIPHIIGGNRDPKVIWHEKSKQWILALYLEKEDYMLFGSKDLKHWEKLCEINDLGCSECPDFFPLAVDGNPDDVRWVFWGGNGKYLIGSFDGKDFKPETEPLTNKYGGNDYAAMTFSDTPDGRRIQLSWMAGARFPGMPFNHQMTVPRVLTLRTTPRKEVRLYMEPVEELNTLRGERYEATGLAVLNRTETSIPNESELFDCEMTVDLNDAKKLSMRFADRPVEYDAVKKEISLDGIRAPLELENNRLKLRVAVDRTSIELFAQEGQVQIAKCFLRKDGATHDSIVLTAEGGSATVAHLALWPMKSVWKRN